MRSKITVKYKAGEFIVIFVMIYLAMMSQEVAIWKVLSEATGFNPEVMRVVLPSLLLSIVTIGCTSILMWISYTWRWWPMSLENRDRIGWWAYVLEANTADNENIKIVGFYRVRYASGSFYITDARAFQVSDEAERAKWKTKKVWSDDTGIYMLLEIDVLGKRSADDPIAYSAFLKLEKTNDPGIFTSTSSPWRGILRPHSGAEPLGGKFYTDKLQSTLASPNRDQLMAEIEPKIDMMFEAVDAGFVRLTREAVVNKDRRAAVRRLSDYKKSPERRSGHDRRVLNII